MWIFHPLRALPPLAPRKEASTFFKDRHQGIDERVEPRHAEAHLRPRQGRAASSLIRPRLLGNAQGILYGSRHLLDDMRLHLLPEFMRVGDVPGDTAWLSLRCAQTLDPIVYPSPIYGTPCMLTSRNAAGRSTSQGAPTEPPRSTSSRARRLHPAHTNPNTRSKDMPRSAHAPPPREDLPYDLIRSGRTGRNTHWVFLVKPPVTRCTHVVSKRPMKGHTRKRSMVVGALASAEFQRIQPAARFTGVLDLSTT